MKVGILRSGVVAQVLAGGFLKHNHEVMMGTRDQGKLTEWKAKNPKARVGSFADAAAFAELVVLAVKVTAAADALRSAGDVLTGKVVMDVTNPIADLPPENGVIRFFTDLNESLMERLQKEFPVVVKAFNSVGNAGMVNPAFAGGKPSMFLCGNDDAAKRTVIKIVEQFGWEAKDMCRAEAARAIEPLCMLWCIPGFLRNDWMHAFKIVR
jgi:predicted dinucleotide-binding enzyme